MSAHAINDLSGIPKTVYVIDGLLPSRSVGTLYAPPGHGKSFGALDLCLSLAAGRGSVWGRRVLRPGPAYYLCGEGAGGLDARARGWSAVHGIDRPGTAVVWDGRADLADPDAHAPVVAGFRKFTAEAPALIVVDTLNRYFAGRDENSATDMGRFLDGCEALRDALGGGTVMLVHHTGHGGDPRSRRERGSSALLGAMDFRIEFDRGTDRSPSVTVTVQKMKHQGETDPFDLALAPARFLGGSSLALLPDDSPAARLARLTIDHRNALAAAARRHGAEAFRRRDVFDAIGADPEGPMKGTVDRALKRGLAVVLTDNGLAGKPRRYRIDPAVLPLLTGAENGPPGGGPRGGAGAGSPAVPAGTPPAGEREAPAA